MDIDLKPWLNGLNYRVVLVAGQQREGDKREEKEEVELKWREKQTGGGKADMGGIESLPKTFP